MVSYQKRPIEKNELKENKIYIREVIKRAPWKQINVFLRTVSRFLPSPFQYTYSLHCLCSCTDTGNPKQGQCWGSVVSKPSVCQKLVSFILAKFPSTVRQCAACFQLLSIPISCCYLTLWQQSILCIQRSYFSCRYDVL